MKMAEQQTSEAQVAKEQMPKKESTMKHGSNFWVIGGEFGSMNFHRLVEGYRHKAGVRFSIVEEPTRAVA
jgi:hypothetical protein